MTHRVGLFVFDGVTMLDVSGPAEVFRAARSEDGSAPYELIYISPTGGNVRTSSNMVITHTTPAAEVAALDTVLICGADHLPTEPISLDVLDAAARLLDRATRVASICTGAFILAELGTLKGRRATTHWRHASALAKRYPDITVEPDIIYSQEHNLFTSAGVTAGMDLALHLVEADLGSQPAREVARELVMFMQRPGSQSQFSTLVEFAPPADSSLRSLLDEVILTPADDHSPATFAARMNVSVRHLSRLFHRELGMPPTRWLERVRTGAAAQLILDGHAITHAAQMSGFGSDETMRRAFHRQFGVSPSEYRSRFDTTMQGVAGSPPALDH